MISAVVALLAVRLEAGPAYDTNVTRVEGESRAGDGFARLVADLDGAVSPASGLRLTAAWQGGAKRYMTETGEDALVQRLDVGFAGRAAPWLVLRLDASARDRTTRDPSLPRDYTRVSGGPSLETRLPAGFGFSVRGIGERFIYKPSVDLNADALGGLATVSFAWDALRLQSSATLLRREFDGPPLVRVAGQPGVGLVTTEPEEGRNRQDDFFRVGGGVRWIGSLVVSADYGFEQNDSNGYGGTFSRHVAQLSVTSELPLGFVGSLSGELTRVTYADPQFITAEQFVEDEGRSAVNARLELPVDEDWSVVAHGGAWFTPAGGGPDFSRQLFGLSVAYATTPE